MKINMNDLVKRTEDIVYSQENKILIESLGVELRRYLPIEQKYGLASKLFQVLYDSEQKIFDYINYITFSYVFILEKYAEALVFPENTEDLDVEGIYNMLVFSGAKEEINEKMEGEISEIKALIDAMIAIEYRKTDIKNPMSDFLSNVSSKSTEEISEIQKQANELMKNENIIKMLELKEKAKG